MSDGAFMGVPEDQVRLLGRLTVAAGRLEHIAWEISVDLGADPRKKQFGEVAKAIERAADEGIPEFARTTPAELRAWAPAARDAMGLRNRNLHAQFFQRRYEDEWRSESVHLRSDTLNPDEGLRSLVTELKELAGTASSLHLGLLREVRDGVYIKHRTIRPGESVCIVVHGDDPSFPRPADQEIEAWVAEFGVESLEDQ